MNLRIPTTLILLATTSLVFGQEPAASTPPAATTPPPTSEATTPSPPPPPIVRLPVSGNAAAPQPETIPAEVPEAAARPAMYTSPGNQLGWKSETVGLRDSTVRNIRTNRTFETRGSVPTLVKPPRRTIGGFLGGFANLFNPFAPTSDGVASSSLNHYDGQFNRAALPHSFRDERNHEASAVLFSTSIEADPEQAAKAAPKATEPAK
jgi:hypothetical protein